MTSRFDIGEQTGHEVDPQKVSTDMQNARDEQNNRLFTRDEWLTKTQIKAFFSRLRGEENVPEKKLILNIKNSCKKMKNMNDNS